eukprot:CAMPEP_0181084446 /NCGR_PEP_ID=MMETSP1071-20121207/4699_1 /TAXON_ID=35127 /ORGANISM="Thalassiosira sp., Strain NH16" /LENGTH=989 /DNA_ID=CAMNT_0023166179 /DNA_START=39 /DNA_END=3004 /DNA_ORIENTATION=-
MKFIKPVGANADLRELEYISALHQVGKALRNDGSIKAEDISKFLMSRYGIKVSGDEVLNTIGKGFGGGGVSEEDGDTIDLTEITALLFVPELIKAEMSLHRDHLEQEKIKAGNSVNEIDNYEMHECKSKLSEDGVWASATPDKIRALRGEDRWPDSDLIEFVLKMILTDVTGDDKPKPMTKDLLRKIFAFYQEHDVVEDEALLDEMISVASKMNMDDDEKGTVPMLDKFTFAHCLTDDVRKYDVSNERKCSTNFSDVFQDEKQQTDKSAEVKTVWTAPSIDYAMDAFRSKSFVILLWVNWALFFYVYMSTSTGGIGQLNCSTDVTTANGFGCQIAQGIINWLLIMTKLIVLGSGSVMLCSMGNHVNPTSPWTIVASILSLGCICLFTIVPAFNDAKVLPQYPEMDDDLFAYDDEYAYNNADSVINTVVNDETALDKIFLIYVMVAFGALLLLMGLANLISRTVRQEKSNWVIQKILTPGTLLMERNMKLASSFKINQILRNARSVHESAEFEHGVGQSNNSYGRALLAFTKIQNDTEEAGGFIWTWKRMWNKKLYTEDGIWLNNRMVQGNVGQLVLCIWLVPWMKWLYDIVEDLYNNFLVEIMPSRWRIVVPLSLAFCLAEFNALKLATSYTPSSVRTTLRYRFGVIGSLHDEEFQKVRTTVDDVSLIFGGMFWGCLYSSTLILIGSFLVIGLCCFEPFLPVFLQFVAIVLGIIITIGLKTLFLMLCRRKFHERAYYRSNPAAANVIGVILEAWSLGVSTLYVLKRMVFLLFAAFVFVGRIDIPFLSEDADQLGPLTLDNFPFTFRKDLLSHEAHRHPYLERIGVVYMLKLKHGEGFGRESGTSWRLLFVFALLPWLRKYRARAGDNDFDMNQFKFSKGGDIFDRFVSGKADGLRGRTSLGRIPESEEVNKDNDAEDKGGVTLESLRKENELLRQEIEMLKLHVTSGENEVQSRAQGSSGSDTGHSNVSLATAKPKGARGAHQHHSQDV